MNDAPVASAVNLGSVAEEGSVTITAAQLLAGVTDVDGPAATITSFTLTSGNGTLVDNLNGTWTYTGALNDDTLATFAYTASDGTLSSSSTASLDLTPVNDAPVNTKPGAQSVNEDITLVFSSANSNAITISDVDLGAGTATVTLTVGNGTLTLGSTTGLTGLSGNGTGTVSFTGVLADINAALSGLAYTGNLNFNGSDTLTIKTNDNGNTGTDPGLSGNGTSEEDIDTVAITINAVNDAPINNKPGAQSVNEDTNLVFSSANSNAITISDVDVGSGNQTVTLTVGSGTLTLGSTSGLTGLTGNGTGTVSFTGTLANVNAALSGLAYKGNSNFNGSDTLTITTNDNGNTGIGGAQSDVDTIAITVSPVNDAPVGLTFKLNYNTGDFDPETSNSNLVANGIVGKFTADDSADSNIGFYKYVSSVTRTADATKPFPFTLDSDDGELHVNPLNTNPAAGYYELSVVIQELDGPNGNLIGVSSTPQTVKIWLGNQGAETVTLESGTTLALGLSGNDQISVFGDATENFIVGGRANDTINAGAGNDVLQGGIGQDTLTGGTGSDTFAFKAGDSNSSNRDLITDFEVGIDKIDLSVIDAQLASGDQAFSWAGLAPVTTAEKTGAAWYTQSGGNTFVFADYTGDGVADLEVQLTGLKALSAGDFIL